MTKRERLFAIVEEIRAGKYPRLDATLVEEILFLQVQLQEDRPEAHKRTARTISKWASANAATENTG